MKIFDKTCGERIPDDITGEYTVIMPGVVYIYKNKDILHNEKGPAALFNNKYKLYFLDGKQYHENFKTDEEWQRFAKLKVFL